MEMRKRKLKHLKILKWGDKMVKDEMFGTRPKFLEEYIGKKSNGEVNQQWSTKAKTMIRKVAIVQALREAFPQELSAMYVEEEFQKPDPVPTDHTEVEFNENPEISEV